MYPAGLVSAVLPEARGCGGVGTCLMSILMWVERSDSDVKTGPEKGGEAVEKETAQGFESRKKGFAGVGRQLRTGF